MSASFNWVGNKQRYFDLISPYVSKYHTVIDPMMGSGNVLIRFLPEKEIIGNDVMPLMPDIYSRFDNFRTDAKVFEEVLEKWDFHKEGTWVKYRKYWSEKFKSFNYDKLFLAETYILLKLTVNSLVRFNSSGEFNAPFDCNRADDLYDSKDWQRAELYFSLMRDKLHNGKSTFSSLDVIQFLAFLHFDAESSVFIIDPPYLLTNEHDYYKKGTYDLAKERHILTWLVENKCKFILFNYIKWNNRIHGVLRSFITDNKFSYQILSKSSNTGLRKENASDVCEVMVTNISI